jgi:heme/copper-type cytochrome/quinol oxidase subunit 3
MVWQRAKLGMAMLLIAESVFFFMLIIAFVYFRDESQKTAAATLSLRMTSVYTACLLTSSFTLWRGWAGLTMIFGGTFLAGQVNEYLRLLRSGITVSQGLFETTFFTLTGIHGLHVLIGLVLLGVAAGNKIPRQSAAMFWHFVGIAWIVIFSIVYVWSFL